MNNEFIHSIGPEIWMHYKIIRRIFSSMASAMVGKRVCQQQKYATIIKTLCQV